MMRLFLFVLCVLALFPHAFLAFNAYETFKEKVRAFFSIIEDKQYICTIATPNAYFTYFIYKLSHETPCADLYAKYILPEIIISYSTPRFKKYYSFLSRYPQVASLLLAYVDYGCDLLLLEKYVFEMISVVRSHHLSPLFYGQESTASEMELLDFLMPYFFNCYWPKKTMHLSHASYQVFEGLCQEFKVARLHLYFHYRTVFRSLRAFPLVEARLLDREYFRDILVGLVPLLIYPNPLSPKFPTLYVPDDFQEVMHPAEIIAISCSYSRNVSSEVFSDDSKGDVVIETRLSEFPTGKLLELEEISVNLASYLGTLMLKELNSFVRDPSISFHFIDLLPLSQLENCLIQYLTLYRDYDRILFYFSESQAAQRNWSTFRDLFFEKFVAEYLGIWFAFRPSETLGNFVLFYQPMHILFGLFKFYLTWPPNSAWEFGALPLKSNFGSFCCCCVYMYLDDPTARKVSLCIPQDSKVTQVLNKCKEIVMNKIDISFDAFLEMQVDAAISSFMTVQRYWEALEKLEEGHSWANFSTLIRESCS